MSAPILLYRVHHASSFTIFNEDGDNAGFESAGHYYMDYSHWLTARKFHQHLDWGSRSAEGSPFISVFDNLSEEARNQGISRGLQLYR